MTKAEEKDTVSFAEEKKGLLWMETLFFLCQRSGTGQFHKPREGGPPSPWAVFALLLLVTH